MNRGSLSYPVNQSLEPLPCVGVQFYAFFLWRRRSGRLIHAGQMWGNGLAGASREANLRKYRVVERFNARAADGRIYEIKKCELYDETPTHNAERISRLHLRFYFMVDDREIERVDDRTFKIFDPEAGEFDIICRM